MWVAAYEISSPPLPAGWMTYSYWQYTSVGTVPGVATPGGTDLDSFSPSAVALIDPGPSRAAPSRGSRSRSARSAAWPARR